jgi:hypothetical protein
MPNFEKPFTNARGKYDLYGTASPTPGEVKRLTIPEMTWGNIQLFQSEGPVAPDKMLTVACDTTNVVPADGINPTTATLPRTIIELYGMFAGKCQIQAGLGAFKSATWAEWAQRLEVVVPANPSEFYILNLKSPHMVLNSDDVPDTQYVMDYPKPYQQIPSKTDPKMKREDIIALIEKNARMAPGGKLNHLVMNCHGSGTGTIQLGTWFDQFNSLNLFKSLKGLVDCIWLQSCNIAGCDQLCTTIATSVGCYVVGYVMANPQFRRQWKNGEIDLFTRGQPKVYIPNGPTTFDQNNAAQSLMHIRKLPQKLRTFDAITPTKLGR